MRAGKSERGQDDIKRELVVRKTAELRIFAIRGDVLLFHDADSVLLCHRQCADASQQFADIDRRHRRHRHNHGDNVLQVVGAIRRIHRDVAQLERRSHSAVLCGDGDARIKPRQRQDAQDHTPSGDNYPHYVFDGVFGVLRHCGRDIPAHRKTVRRNILKIWRHCRDDQRDPRDTRHTFRRHSDGRRSADARRR